jgi:hypothetical protein
MGWRLRHCLGAGLQTGGAATHSFLGRLAGSDDDRRRPARVPRALHQRSVFHGFLLHCLVHGLQPSDERLSLQESYTSQALVHSSARLWSWEITALALVGIGIAMLVVDTGNWLIALALIVIFGLCAAGVMWMLVLRRRASYQKVPR